MFTFLLRKLFFFEFSTKTHKCGTRKCLRMKRVGGGGGGGGRGGKGGKKRLWGKRSGNAVA